LPISECTLHHGQYYNQLTSGMEEDGSTVWKEMISSPSTIPGMREDSETPP